MMSLKCAISYSSRNGLAMREAERIWRLNTGKPAPQEERSNPSVTEDETLALWKRGHVKLVVTRDQFVHVMQLTT